MATVAQGHEAGRLADEIDMLTAAVASLQAIITANQTINQVTIGQGSALYSVFLPFNQDETNHILNQLIAAYNFMIDQATTQLAAL